jgi:ribonucleoside-diphosphate reductase alpha chain
MAYSMRVKKRDGTTEPVSFDKVLSRIRKASRDLQVNADALAQRVLSGIYDGVTTTELDELSSQTASSLSSNHPDWGVLASRIAISNHHKKTDSSFSKVMLLLSSQVNPKLGNAPISYVSDEVIRICSNPDMAAKLDAAIVPERDYDFDFFGFKTLEKSYLLKDSSLIIRERPQHMWMRVALCLWGENLDRVIETYNMLSTKQFTHATPTLFSAGTPRQQLSSCFLITMSEDSISGIYDTLKECAMISKHAGGIGLSCHTVRAKGSAIMGTNGISDGLVPMLRVFDSTACYVNQGGRRNGSFAIYLSPDHADIEDVLRLKLNNGLEKERARDLFYALWIPDLFMKRVEANGEWSLFCPSEAPGLADTYGKEYEALYTKYEEEGRARKKVSAQKLWFQILDAQMETGTPYLLYKDAANEKSNQKNLGTIRSSNLCTEIMEYSSPDETAVCNLASLSLPAFVVNGAFDYAKLEMTVRVAVRNLNRVIDINYYPTPKTERSNFRHRPVGLGVQGLADVFAMLKLSWETPEALELNQRIFEHIYYMAVDESCNLAEVEGSYSSFPGSPTSQGLLQPDLWNVTPLTQKDGTLNWDKLRSRARTGIRNSLLVAPMPTASTAQILGNTECFEPVTSNLYSRRVLAGEYSVINKHLLKELIDLDLWCDKLKMQIVVRYGSVQGIPEIPLDIQARYKTVWEISQKTLIDMAAARGAFIDQSQSLNLFIEKPTYANLTSMHFYAWRAGLKTGCYYLRTKAQTAAQQFTVDPRLLAAISTGGPAVEDDDEIISSDEEDDTARLAAIAAKKKEERKTLRETLDSLEVGNDVCLNCSS